MPITYQKTAIVLCILVIAIFIKWLMKRYNIELYGNLDYSMGYTQYSLGKYPPCYHRALKYDPCWRRCPWPKPRKYAGCDYGCCVKGGGFTEMQVLCP